MSDDRPSTCADFQARHNAVLSELGVSRYEYALFGLIYYDIGCSVEHMPGYAITEFHDLNGPADEAKLRTALTDCFAKGWLRVIDEPAIAEIAAALRAGGFIGPTHPMPPVGRVDFTPAGAELWHAIQARNGSSGAAVGICAAKEVVRHKSAHYFRTEVAAIEHAANAQASEHHYGAEVIVTGPMPTGPWRVRWWQRFPQGYRVDVNEQGRWADGSEDCHLYISFDQRADTLRLHDVLARHNLTFAEWVALAEVMDGPHNFAPNLLHQLSHADPFAELAAMAERQFQSPITAKEYRDGLETCLRYGWLRVLDHAALAEIRGMLRDDTAHLAVPRTANLLPTECDRTYNPGSYEHVPVPKPDDDYVGSVDFTPAGAALFLGIIEDWLGPDWADSLQVSNGYYREEHRYCDTEDGFRGIVEEYRAKGQDVRSVTVEPVGPWCVRWWDRHPAGFRLTIVVGEP